MAEVTLSGFQGNTKKTWQPLVPPSSSPELLCKTSWLPPEGTGLRRPLTETAHTEGPQGVPTIGPNLSYHLTAAGETPARPEELSPIQGTKRHGSSKSFKPLSLLGGGGNGTELFSAMVMKQHPCTILPTGQGVKKRSCHPRALRVYQGSLCLHRLEGVSCHTFSEMCTNSGKQNLNRARALPKLAQQANRTPSLLCRTTDLQVPQQKSLGKVD